MEYVWSIWSGWYQSRWVGGGRWLNRDFLELRALARTAQTNDLVVGVQEGWLESRWRDRREGRKEEGTKGGMVAIGGGMGRDNL